MLLVCVSLRVRVLSKHIDVRKIQCPNADLESIFGLFRRKISVISSLYVLLSSSKSFGRQISPFVPTSFSSLVRCCTSPPELLSGFRFSYSTFEFSARLGQRPQSRGHWLWLGCLASRYSSPSSFNVRRWTTSGYNGMVPIKVIVKIFAYSFGPPRLSESPWTFGRSYSHVFSCPAFNSLRRRRS